MNRLLNVSIATLIFVVALLLFTVYLPPYFSLDEVPLALYAKTMWQHGWQWFANTYQGLYDYNLSTVVTLVYITAIMMGKVSTVASVLPSAIASGITLSLTYLLGALRSWRLGLLAVLFVLGTPAFIMTSRSLAISPYLTAITTMAMLIVIVFETENIIFYSALSLVLALGFSIAGIIGLLLPTVVAVIYLLWRLQIKKCCYVIVAALVLLLVGMIALLWSASLQGKMALISTVINQQLALITPPTHQQLNKWLLLPYISSLTVAAITSLARSWQLILPNAKWEIQFLRAMITWVIILIALAFFYHWQANMLLPITPALGLIAAYLFNDQYHDVITAQLQQLVRLFFMLTPIVALVMTAMAWLTNYFHYHAYNTPFYLPSFILLSLLCVLMLFFRTRKTNNKIRDVLPIALIALAAYLVVTIAVISPIKTYHSGTFKLMQQLAAAEKNHYGDIVFYQLGPGQEDMVIMANLKQTRSSKPPIFIKQPKQLQHYKHFAYFISYQKIYQQLVATSYGTIRLITRQKIGNNIVVVFTKQSSATLQSSKQATSTQQQNHST